MLLTFNKVMTALLQWYQLRHLGCSITVYCHNVSVPQIKYHQYSHDCFIRMLSINMAYPITITCMSHVINMVMTALSQCQQYTLIVLLQCTTIICYSINPDCFQKPIKLLRTHTVDAKISDGSQAAIGKVMQLY